MTTDHMELRDTLKPSDDGRILIMVKRILIEELLAEFDMLKASSAKTTGYTPEFEEAWSEYPKRPGNSKAAAFKAWKASLKRGATVEQLVEGTRAYAAYCKAKRTEPEYVKQAATFYGPGEHYAADWTVAKTAPLNAGAGWTFPASSQGRQPFAQQQVADQRAANSAAAKARLLGHRPPPDDDGMTFEMGQP